MFTRVIFKETLVLMCLASVFGTLTSWKLCVGHCVMYYAKEMLHYFGCVEVRMLVEKEIYMKLIGNDSFLFKYTVTCKQNFSKCSLFILKLI